MRRFHSESTVGNKILGASIVRGKHANERASYSPSEHTGIPPLILVRRERALLFLRP